MHTTNGSAVIFHHNGDFSGEVIIQDKPTGTEMIVPFDDLKRLVAEYVRRKRICSLEDQNDDALLGLCDLSNLFPPA